jgi:hypothetical protein
MCVADPPGNARPKLLILKNTSNEVAVLPLGPVRTNLNMKIRKVESYIKVPTCATTSNYHPCLMIIFRPIIGFFFYLRPADPLD